MSNLCNHDHDSRLPQQIVEAIHKARESSDAARVREQSLISQLAEKKASAGERIAEGGDAAAILKEIAAIEKQIEAARYVQAHHDREIPRLEANFIEAEIALHDGNEAKAMPELDSARANVAKAQSALNSAVDEFEAKKRAVEFHHGAAWGARQRQLRHAALYADVYQERETSKLPILNVESAR